MFEVDIGKSPTFMVRLLSNHSTIGKSVWLCAYNARWECKTNPLCRSGAFNEYFLCRFHLYLLLFACSSSKPWLCREYLPSY